MLALLAWINWEVEVDRAESNEAADCVSMLLKDAASMSPELLALLGET